MVPAVPVGKNRSCSNKFVGLVEEVENGRGYLVRMIHRVSAVFRTAG